MKENYIAKQLTLEQDLNTLIEGCLINNRRAQEQLYRQLYGLAMSVAFRYSRDEMDAKDILSHSFVKVFKNIKSFDSNKGSFQAWLKKIISNEALDHIKQRSRFSPLEIDHAEEPHIESAVIKKIDESALMTLIQELPRATHAVFVMYVLDGYTHKEIAEKLGISEGTSKWHLSEGRKALQQKLMNLKIR